MGCMDTVKKKEDVLLSAIRAIESGNLRMTFHAIERMKERNILLNEIEEAIFNGKREEHKDEFNPERGSWKYAIRGNTDDEDKELRIVIAFKDPLTMVITVIDLDL